jgi:two-component system CheB/CheR fusion protein
MNGGTLFLDTDLKIRFFSPAIKTLFNIIPSDVGRPLADLVLVPADHELLADARKMVTDMATIGASIEREVAVSGDIWLLRRIFPCPTQNGQVDGVVITFADITERKRAEIALEVAKREAERSNAAKSRFLAAASHDLRQPLQSMTLLLALLGQTVDGDEPKKLVGRFEQMLRGMSGMLNTLLDINQIEAGIIEPRPVDFALADIFARLRDEFGHVAQARGLDLRVVPTAARVESDPRLLEQMIRNLIGNAVKYTAHGKILFGCRRRGQCLRIEVWDTGIGIEAGQLRAIFDEFHQVDNATRERSRGLGLGLAIVERLGCLLGHEVDVRSVPGKGSVFAISVPLRIDAGAQPDEPAPVEAEDETPIRHHRRIVVVEDDPDILDLLKQSLRCDGYVVSGATDANTARNMVLGGAIRPEILLTDYDLPNGMYGLDLVSELRASLGDDLPAIILTGDIAPETREKIVREDCIQLCKPVDSQELVQAIEQSCPRSVPQSSPIGERVTAGHDSMTYIVDDDPDIRTTIREFLEDQGRNALDFDSAEAFLAADRPAGAGCLLVDAHMPGMSGVGLLGELRARNDHLPVILMTGHGDIGLAVDAMRAGACDFIEKPVGRVELLASIDLASDRSHDIRIAEAAHRDAAARVAELTARQRQVMDMVLAGHPNKNIAADLGISQRTVENHRAGVMHRMGVKSIPELARVVMVAQA